jgi:ABC-type uncharacterized transport system substrate-binding protein
MKRREFITLFGGAATWPLAARAQQPALPVVGFLHGASPQPYAPMVVAFRQGLSDTGYVEGQNVAIEFRWANDQLERLPSLAADLVHRQVTVIAAIGGSDSALAAKNATLTIPVVFAIGADPEKLGLVASFNRPGGNVTGIAFQTAALEAKRLELLRELVPKAKMIAVLLRPRSVSAQERTSDILAAARTLGLQIVLVEATSKDDLDAAFASLVQHRSDALVIDPDPLFNDNRNQIVALAARHKVPAIYQDRQYTAAGGLISYGTNFLSVYRQLGLYTGQILKGERPANLPVIQPTNFELVINLKTANSLGLDVPAKLLALADEVIE